MTINRTVELSEEQVSDFEKLAHQDGFGVFIDNEPEMPEEIQQQMEERARN